MGVYGVYVCVDMALTMCLYSLQTFPNTTSMRKRQGSMDGTQSIPDITNNYIEHNRRLNHT